MLSKISIMSVSCITFMAQGLIAADPVFEIANKHKSTIVATVQMEVPLKSGFAFHAIHQVKVPPNERRATFNPDLLATSKIRVFIDLDASKEPALGAEGHDFVYEFPNASGMTKYVTFNPSKNPDKAKWLYPQTGTLMGISGKTESGYSLKKNIRQENIRPVKSFSRGL